MDAIYLTLEQTYDILGVFSEKTESTKFIPSLIFEALVML